MFGINFQVENHVCCFQRKNLMTTVDSDPKNPTARPWPRRYFWALLHSPHQCIKFSMSLILVRFFFSNNGTEVIWSFFYWVIAAIAFRRASAWTAWISRRDGGINQADAENGWNVNPVQPQVVSQQAAAPPAYVPPQGGAQQTYAQVQPAYNPNQQTYIPAPQTNHGTV